LANQSVKTQHFVVGFGSMHGPIVKMLGGSAPSR
jgi:hypothetical protein